MGAKLYEVETHEKYYLTVEEVKRQIEQCPRCGAKFIQTHYSDPKNMVMQESSKCLECDYGQKDVYHTLN